MTADPELIEEYRTDGHEEAVSAIVLRYVDLVYSAALRQVQERALAEDVTQAVFIVLSRKINTLDPKTVIAGWLLRTTRFASLKALRTEARRRRTEQKAFEMNVHSEGEPTWQQIAPILDQAIAKLGQKDRDALVLRFFENKTFAQVAGEIGTTEGAAKKRVTRALDRLRAMFGSGQLPAAALGAILAAESVKAAPAGLAANLSTQVGAAAVSPSAWILAKETLRAMFWAKLQTAAAIATVVVMATATVGMAVWTVEGGGLSTPKRALRTMAKAFTDGEGDKFANGLFLTINGSPAEAGQWKPTLSKLVVAQADLRRAVTREFGAEAVSNAMPLWHGLDQVVSRLMQAEDRVAGQQAKFPMTLFGRTFPDVPLMVQTNRQWKFALDLSFEGGKKITGGGNNNLGFSIQGNGIHLSLGTRWQFDSAKAKRNVEGWADSLSQVANRVRAGEFASAEEAWRECGKQFEKITE